MSVKEVDPVVRSAITARMVALVNIKRKLERLYKPKAIRSPSDNSVECDVKVLEGSSVEQDRELARELKKRFTDLSEFIDNAVATPCGQSAHGIFEEIQSKGWVDQ
ncbi:MAG: hypothetical protein OEN01_10585 [Candidatus Krumholzibacteria bacterium]|nr:hypothetical protein [Candidatus Krumholzibacteria bacterium]